MGETKNKPQNQTVDAAETLDVTHIEATAAAIDIAIDNVQSQASAAVDAAQAGMNSSIDAVQGRMNAGLDVAQARIEAVTGAAREQVAVAKAAVQVVAQQIIQTINTVFELIPIAGFEVGLAALETVLNAIGGIFDELFDLAEDTVDDAAGAANKAVDKTIKKAEAGLQSATKAVDDVYGRVAKGMEDASSAFNNLRAKAVGTISSLFGSNIKKYVPSYAIYLNGSRIGGDIESRIIDIQVIDRVDVLSSFSFTIADPDCRYMDSDALFIGSSVKIKMGYKDALEELMDGEITGMSAYFRQEGTSVTIRGHNRMHRLARGNNTKSYGISTPFFTLAFTQADVIRQMALENGLIPLVDFFGVRRPFQLKREQSDLDYILTIARKYNRRVLVDGRKLFVLPMLPKIDPNAKVEWRKSLTHFEARQSTLGLVTDVVVRGLDRNGKALTASADPNKVLFRIGGITMGAALSKKAFGQGKAIVIDYDAPDQMSMEESAISYLTENSLEYVRASGRCQGNMAVRAATMMTVLGVGKNFSGIYYVTQVRHRISPYFGYETHFDCVRNVSMKMPSLLDMMSSGIAQNLMQSTGLNKVAESVGNAVNAVKQVVNSVKEAMEKLKQFKDILEEARRRAKEMVNAVKKQVLEKLRDVKKQVDKFREEITEVITEMRKVSGMITKAQQQLTAKVQSYQNQAMANLSRIENKITEYENKIKQARENLNQQIDYYQQMLNDSIDHAQTEVQQQLQAELDEQKAKAEAELLAYENQLNSMKGLYASQKEMFEAKITELTDKFQKQINEVKSIYNDAKAQVDAAVNSVRNVEKKLREIWNRVQEEAKKIIKELIDDFINDVQPKIMSAVPDIDRMESIALGARKTLFNQVKDAVPRLRKAIEDSLTGIVAEFKAIIVNARMLFERVKGFMGQIAVMLGSLLGGAGNLKWYKDGAEIDAAMVGETVTMYAKVNDIPDGTTLTLKLYEKDYIGDNDFIKDFTATVRDGTIEVAWKVEYVEDRDDENSQEEQQELGYTKPEYIFVIKSDTYQINEESAVLEMKDWVEIKINDENGKPLANKKYNIMFPDGNNRSGELDAHGYARIENIPPGKHKIEIDNGSYVLIQE